MSIFIEIIVGFVERRRSSQGSLGVRTCCCVCVYAFKNQIRVPGHLKNWRPSTKNQDEKYKIERKKKTGDRQTHTVCG